jgi:aminoglycoside phosphotransferase (APT) family kinase protein
MASELEAEQIAAANVGTGEVRTPLDEASLAAWMATNVDGFAGPLSVEQFNGGQSNPTYRLSTPDRRYVLRRKPPGPLVPGAHDVLREARVQAALAGSDVPVAHIAGICADSVVIGSEFYLMEMVEGRIFWDAAFGEVPIEQRASYFGEMNRVISELHQIDYEARGLGNHGRNGNYFSRQIARWSRQYQEDELAGRDRDMDALVAWLPTAIPDADETALIHGDFRCDNMIFHPTEPRILAVLDWELSTLGHPLADFAYHTMFYSMPPDIVAGLGGQDPESLGIPTEADYVAAYCRRTGRDGIANWDFYIAFNYFRLAAIFHGIRGRVLRGTASNSQAAQRAQAFGRLVQLGKEAMDRCR